MSAIERINIRKDKIRKLIEEIKELAIKNNLGILTSIEDCEVVLVNRKIKEDFVDEDTDEVVTIERKELRVVLSENKKTMRTI